MPTIKRNLTRPEKLDNLARAKKMRADGVDLQIREDWLETARSLDIFVTGGPESFIFDLPDGRAGYVIGLRMVPRRRVTLLRYCQITTAWDDQIMLDGGLDNRGGRHPMYRLFQLLYPLNQVLNQRIENQLKFQGRGQMAEGFLLASGLKPFPGDYHHGMAAPIVLTLFDQNENEICQNADLFVDRTWQHERKVVHSKSSLRDPVEIPETSEPRFRPNLNVGPVRDTAAEMFKNRAVRKEAEAESEPLAALRKALSQLRQR
jgi:hypothetical protein